MSVSITIALTYVATKLADQLITQEGYGRIRKFLFHRRYVDKLYEIIEETASEFESKYPLDTHEIPFYHSKPLFEALNSHILFQDFPDRKELLDKFQQYPNVLIPTKVQLELFYDILSRKIAECKTVKELYINESYKHKIFDINNEILEIKLLLQSLDEKLTIQLDDEWLHSKCSESISDLGGRYTPELNVNLDISKVFEGIGRTELFLQIFILRSIVF